MANITFALSSVLILATLAAANPRMKLSGYSSAEVDEWVDKFLENLRPQLILRNLDPLKAPDMSLDFKFNFLFQEHNGQLNLSDSWVMGMSTVARHGECVMNYDLHLLRIDLSLIVKELMMDFEYDLTALGMSPSGNLNAHITDQMIYVGLLIDVQEATATLQHLDLPNDGDLKISVDGLGLLGDALAGVVLGVIDNLFKDTVIRKVAETLQSIIEGFLDGFNPLPTIPPPTFLQYP